MERRFKGLVAINDVLDDRYQKLSDKYHDLELSHNRKKKALEQLLEYCRGWRPVMPPDYQIIADICESALWSDGRERQALKKKKITMATVKARKNNG